MVIYGIEEIKRNNNKKILIIVLIITVLILTIAILAGKKTAEKFAMQNRESVEKNELPIQEENKHISEPTDKPIDAPTNEPTNKPTEINKNLSDEQIKKINSIYSSNEKRAFLTFDDGPSNTVTPQILDILKKENIKATFFVLGTMVKNNPNIIKRENAEGHYIANHGYSHIYNKIYASENTVLEEYNMTNKNIQDALENPEYNSNVFRFPGGSVGGYYNDIKKKAKEILAKEGIASLDWNCLTNDADGANTKDAIMKNLKSTCNRKKQYSCFNARCSK